MSDQLTGQRLPDVAMGDPPEAWEPWKRRRPGDYMRVTMQDGKVRWWICDPLGRVGQVGGQRVHLEPLEGHTNAAGYPELVPVLQPAPVEPWSITEHEDGTITVRPSIMEPGGWHGFLERGVWRTA